ncbi:DNA replication endonuclease-helicase Dna2 [Coemansia sp. RSA 1822]|nr:DNA replication endonuclease-helicase Dna2 [Coemansia sp. RSA 638]KAJ2541335.1 DNA replication endonuclease-helicase Dna2 [Coemansia sp. RSA 1853]KAJ2562476.1 DNA replication endonuclease-helicase Dna2 [Coemansia sp. RSA 1822]
MPETPTREGQKRPRTPASPLSKRAQSADTPLSKRTQTDTPLSKHVQTDTVFWMPMSPQNTLRKAIRASSANTDSSSIVQSILDGRQHAQDMVLSTQGDGGDADDEALKFAAADVTPVARRTRAVPRPLTLCKSEKQFDKRQLLSSLLVADGPIKDCGSPTLRTCVPKSHSPHIDKDEDSGDSPTLRVCQTEDSTQQRTNGDLSLDDDLCLDDGLDDGLDGLMDGLDDFDDLMQGLDEDFDDIDATVRDADDHSIDNTQSQRFRDYEKCLVLLVTDGWYSSTRNHVEAGGAGVWRQKVVRVYSQTAVRERVLLLRSEWYETPIAIGDYMNIVGTLDGSETESGEVIIDSQRTGILPILHPDILVSCTHLADTISCVRRAVLRDRVREISEGAPSTVMLIGTLLHDLFQTCALQNRWDDEMMRETIWKLVRLNVERLWESNMDEESAVRQVEEIVPVYQQWARTYMRGRVQDDAQYAGHNGGNGAVAVAQIMNMEENVWSAKFGLKGKVDLTVLAQYAQLESGPTGRLEPFELKTGRRTDNAGHRAQVMMYTLLLADRYGVDVDAGLLYYPRTGQVVRVERHDNELRALVMMRNTMTQHLQHAAEAGQRALPDMLGNEFMCTRCAYQGPCFITHRAMEDGNAQTARVDAQVWATQTAHLSSVHVEFVRKWMSLIDGEEADMLRFRAELWTMAALYREAATGRCLADMRLDVHSVEDTRNVGSFSRYRMTFVPNGERRSMLDTQLGPGDPVVVSAEPSQYALAVGYVVAMEHKHVTVALDRPVRGVPKRVRGFDRVRSQLFEPILEIWPHGTNGDTTTVHDEVPASAACDVFRIDKDEMNSAMSRVRANVMRLFVGSMALRHRRLIVDLQAPAFLPVTERAELLVRSAQREQQLNGGQVLVLRRVLSADDYALVMGMPGTGKTTTIAALVRVLVSLGKSVLLASYTHAAVDNVLLKLVGSGIAMVRLGSRAKIHPRVADQLMPPSFSTVRELDAYFASAQVVATTCLGVTHALFSRRRFDFCIVDEASQITLPVCLGPLLAARRFVLVGDQHQLPPLVRSAGARDAGLGTSLFKRLCDAHPDSVVRLEFQYRMSAGIQRLANCLIYDGHLRCASLAVAKRRIAYAVDPREAAASLGHAMWAASALDASRAAVFVDTDLIRARENRVEGSDSAQNDTEIGIIRALTTMLQACGVEGRNVCVLSPYRAQLRQLEVEFGIRREPSMIETDPVPSVYPGIEVHTVDRYQGRDAEVVLISWVRSNSGQAVGELLRDWHRINVAITRARNKLVMVGSRSTLERSPLLAAMLRILDQDKCIVNIPAGTVVPHVGAGGGRKSGAQTKMANQAVLKKMPIVGNILAEQA